MIKEVGERFGGVSISNTAELPAVARLVLVGTVIQQLASINPWLLYV